MFAGEASSPPAAAALAACRVVCHPAAAAALAAAVASAPPGQTALLVTVLASHLPQLPRAALAAATHGQLPPKKKKARKSEGAPVLEEAAGGSRSRSASAAADCAASALAALSRVFAAVLRSARVTAETAAPAGGAIRTLLEQHLPLVGSACLAVDAVPTTPPAREGTKSKRKAAAAAAWSGSECPFGRAREQGGGHAEGLAMRLDAPRTALLAFAMHAYRDAVSVLELCAALSPDVEAALASRRSYFESLGPECDNPPLLKVLVEWTRAPDPAEDLGHGAYFLTRVPSCARSLNPASRQLQNPTQSA